jgi:hypothetical protein
MDTRLGSQIIKQEGLGEPHVIVGRTATSVALLKLADVLQAVEAKEQVVLMSAVLLDVPSSLTDLIPDSDFPEGSVTYFENIGGGRLRSYVCQITEDGKEAIAEVLNRVWVVGQKNGASHE